MLPNRYGVTSTNYAESDPVTPQASRIRKQGPASPDYAIKWKYYSKCLLTLFKQLAEHDRKAETGLSSTPVTIVDAAETLVQTLLKLKSNIEDPLSPLVVLSFDEAHALSKALSPMKGSQRSMLNPTSFTCLRRALRNIRYQRVFSLFLSNTGQVFRFKAPKAIESSARLTAPNRFELMEPYSDLGYDMMVSPAKEGVVRMEDVMKTSFMIKFGRPL
jgi:hypothetical protein